MYQTTDFRKGLKIEIEGKPWIIVDFQHVNPGKGSAFVRTRIRNLETNQTMERTFKAGVETVGKPDMEEKEMEFNYAKILDISTVKFKGLQLKDLLQNFLRVDFSAKSCLDCSLVVQCLVALFLGKTNALRFLKKM